MEPYGEVLLKYIFCATEERKPSRFGTKWWRVHDDRIFLFGCTIPFFLFISNRSDHLFFRRAFWSSHFGTALQHWSALCTVYIIYALWNTLKDGDQHSWCFCNYKCVFNAHMLCVWKQMHVCGFLIIGVCLFILYCMYAWYSVWAIYLLFDFLNFLLDFTPD